MAVQADPATRDRAPAVADTPLPLENGDRLTRGEFERRYAARPDLKKAELIEGVVYMPAAVRSASHAEPHAAILGWLVTYGAATPGVRAADNATVRLDLDNEPQPDALLRIVPAAGGQARMSSDDYLDGAPELIVEIAASSAAIDLHDKLRAYRRNGVQEYVVWRVLEQQIDWFELSGGEYRRLTANPAGIMESRVFPGLRLAVDAMLQRDLATVLAELQTGLSTPEHARFVEHLRSVSAAGEDRNYSIHEPWDKTSEETRTLFHDLKKLVKSLGSVRTEETTTVSPRHVTKSVINFMCTAAPGATLPVVASVHLLVRGGLDVHIHEKHLSAIPLEDGFTRPTHRGYRKIMIRDREHIQRAEPLLRAAYDDLHKHGHARAKGGEALNPVTHRRPGDSPSASSPRDRRIPPKQRRRRRIGDRDYLQLGENHEP